jgi:hypothetical protein
LVMIMVRAGNGAWGGTYTSTSDASVRLCTIRNN